MMSVIKRSFAKSVTTANRSPDSEHGGMVFLPPTLPTSHAGKLSTLVSDFVTLLSVRGFVW